MQHLHYIAVERCLADEAFHVAAVVQKLHTAFAADGQAVRVAAITGALNGVRDGQAPVAIRDDAVRIEKLTRNRKQCTGPAGVRSAHPSRAPGFQLVRPPSSKGPHHMAGAGIMPLPVYSIGTTR